MNAKYVPDRWMRIKNAQTILVPFDPEQHILLAQLYRGFGLSNGEAYRAIAYWANQHPGFSLQVGGWKRNQLSGAAPQLFVAKINVPILMDAFQDAVRYTPKKVDAPSWWGFYRALPKSQKEYIAWSIRWAFKEEQRKRTAQK